MRALAVLVLCATACENTSASDARGAADAAASAADAAAGAADAAAGAADAAAPTLAAIGLACDDSHPCPSGAVCGPCGIATGQCVYPCTASGTAGCPSGSYCSKAGSNKFWTGNYNAHFCVRLCDGDSACQMPTGNPGISCNGAYNDDDSSGPQICNVSNSIGSTHACP
jgi:hypothetical protein